MKDVKIHIEEYGDGGDQWMVYYSFTLRGVKMMTMGLTVDMYTNADHDWERLCWAIDQARAELSDGLMVDVETSMVESREE